MQAQADIRPNICKSLLNIWNNDMQEKEVLNAKSAQCLEAAQLQWTTGKSRSTSSWMKKFHLKMFTVCMDHNIFLICYRHLSLVIKYQIFTLELKIFFKLFPSISIIIHYLPTIFFFLFNKNNLVIKSHSANHTMRTHTHTHTLL